MSINVEFSNPHGVYYPGTEVTGVVVLNLESNVKARSVCISVNGRARNHWTETETHTHRNADGTSRTEHRTIHYEANVIYASGEAVVWSDTPSSDKLLAGQHQFPFKFLLPPTCAPSFEATYGYIRYEVAVEIDRKWKFNKTNRRIFTVAPTFDLNTIPQAIMPVEDVKMKNTGMILFRHGKIQVKARLPKMGFVPGERMHVICDIDNGSTRPIVSAEIKLRQLAVFMASRSGYTCHYTHGMHAMGCNHRREERQIVASSLKEMEVAPHSKKTVSVGLDVPSTVASFNSCPITNVEYFVSVKFSTTGTVNSTIKNELPLLIGTVPLYQVTQPNASAPPAYPVLPQNQLPAYPSAYPSTSNGVYPPLAPPDYEETVFGSSGTTKDMDSSEAFAPRYPVYHNLPPAPGWAPPTGSAPAYPVGAAPAYPAGAAPAYAPTDPSAPSAPELPEKM